MSCGVGHRLSLDLVLLWLWPWTGSIAPIGPLACEPPYGMGAAQKKAKKKKNQNKNSGMSPKIVISTSF